jgi:hypothetical protein
MVIVARRVPGAAAEAAPGRVFGDGGTDEVLRRDRKYLESPVPPGFV